MRNITGSSWALPDRWIKSKWMKSKTWTAPNRWVKRKWMKNRILTAPERWWINGKAWTARSRWTGRSWMTRNRWLMLAGVGTLSAGLMYYFDPERGRRRRSLLSDKAVHTGHELQSQAGKTGRDLRNRTKGAAAGLRSFFRFRKTEDDVLIERVRSNIGRAVSHPRSVEVTAQQGRITLSGPVLAQEVEQLIRHVHSVHGVREVENRLDVYDEPGKIPGLQGPGTPRPGEQGAFRRSQWSPAVRAVAGLTGGSAIAYGACRRGSIGAASIAAGSLLLVRAATNLEFRRLTGIGARRRAIDVHKTVHFNAPVSRVFSVWSDFESFPTFMSHVRSVQRLEDGRRARERWHWTVDGPAGTEVQFDSVTTSFEPDRLLAWRTESGSAIQHAGSVRFRDNQDGSTTAELHMTYNPVAGALGHAVARLFGADPKHQLDDDLLRMKTYIETGKPPRDAAQATGAQPGATPGSLH